MSILYVRRDLKQLKAACQRLMERIDVAQEGARYRREKERQQQLSREIKQAMSYIELATRVLDGQERSKSEPSWLRGTMSRLSQALIGDADPSNPSAPIPAKPAKKAAKALEKAAKSGGARQAGKAEAAGPLPDLTPEKPKAPELLGDGDFQGTTRALSVPDLLHLLRAQAQTGVLQVALENEMVFVEFEDGDVVHAYSQNPPPNTRLGEILVAQGAISRERLDSFLFCYTPSLGMLGQALERGELVTEEQLRSALDEQVQRLFNRLFQHDDAEFWFLHKAPRRSDGRQRMNVISLLLESARMQDEANSPG